MRNALACLTVVGVALVWGGCEREELPAICPEIEQGDLVITEIRGEQSDGDTLGQWVEVFNASSRAVDLRGVGLRITPLDGAQESRVLVRESLVVQAGEYAVLGRDVFCFTTSAATGESREANDEREIGSDGEPVTDSVCESLPPPNSDYNAGFDFTKQITATGAGAFLDLEACGAQVDRVEYRRDDLARNGTSSFDGAREPNATDNDRVGGAEWCFDETPPDPDAGPITELGNPGTPGEANRPCP